jgi:simple sugar transport system permease protein
MASEGRSRLEPVVIPLGAVAVTFALFGVFVAVAGHNPLDVYAEMYESAFGSLFAVENTLRRAAPLLLTALCTAIPARLGLTIIGGEGALAVGGLMAAAVGVWMQGSSPVLALTFMMVSSFIIAGVWIAAAGAMRIYRGVNETISSLLLAYIGIALFNHFVEGVLRDPQSLNKPSTRPIGDDFALGTVPGLDVHWGLGFGLIACMIAWVLMLRTTFGFSASVVGGNLRAAKLAGLHVGRLTLISCFLAGGAAGVAGMVEVSAVHGAANASLLAGYGYTGILVAFLARQNPMAIIPVAVLLGGLNVSGGTLQRTFGLPDATVSVLQGALFIVILASETLYGKLPMFAPRSAPTKPSVKLAVV